MRVVGVVLAGVDAHAQALQQALVGLHARIAGGQQHVAVEHRVGAGHEAQRLHGVVHGLAAGRQAHHGARHGDARHRDGAHELERIERLDVGQRRAFHPHQVVDRHRLGVGLHVGQLRDQAGALLARFAHADDAAAADVDAGVAHAVQRVEAVLVGAGGDDLAVELGRGVQVVVVVVQTGLLELFGLALAQHAERDAGLQAERLDRADHLGHGLQVVRLGATPGGAHAEALGAACLGGAGGGQHLVQRHQLFRFQAGVVARRLRAIAAVLGTAAGLDRQQARQLDAVGVEVGAVRLLGAGHQVHERQGVKLHHGGAAPGGRGLRLGRLGNGNVGGLHQRTPEGLRGSRRTRGRDGQIGGS